MKPIFLIFIFFILSKSIYSHTIITKDLRVFYGIVSSMDGQSVMFTSDKGTKKIRKDIIGKIIIQEVKDDVALKKFLKKVKEANPNYVPPSESAPPPPPSTYIDDIEFENAKNLLAEIQEEEKAQALKEKSSSALFKSLLFPGLGEYFLENKKTGIFYGSIFLFSLGGLAYSQNLVNSSVANYKETVSQNTQLAFTLYNPLLTEVKSIEFYSYSLFHQQNAYGESANATQIRNSIAVLPAAIYLLQFLHTYWNVKSYTTDKKVNIKVGFSPTRENPVFERTASSWGGILYVSYEF